MMSRKQFEQTSIRDAGEMDYGQIKNLLQSVDLPLDGVSQNINNYLMLLEGRQLIGTVGLEIYEKKALLRSLAVATAQQGNGYGQKLCHSIIDRARKLNITELYLLTENAEGFFASHGFKIISREMVDRNVKSSVEFQSVCPESATCMILRIG
jgi:amino-acid N-acetyltransferase